MLEPVRRSIPMKAWAPGPPVGVLALALAAALAAEAALLFAVPPEVLTEIPLEGEPPKCSIVPTDDPALIGVLVRKEAPEFRLIEAATGKERERWALPPMPLDEIRRAQANLSRGVLLV